MCCENAASNLSQSYQALQREIKRVTGGSFLYLSFALGVVYFVLPYMLKIYSYLSGVCYVPELLKALTLVILENFQYL